MAFDTSTNRELYTQIINRRYLAQLEKRLQFFKFATVGDVPSQAGDEIRWLNAPEMTADSSVLSQTSATDNAMTSYAFDAVSGTINPYGQYITIPEHMAKTMTAGSLEQIADRLAEVGRRVVDGLLQTACTGATNYFKQGQVASNTGFITASDHLTAATLNYVQAELDALGNMGFDSENGQFAGIFSTQQVAHLRGEAATTSGNVTWAEVNKYVAGQQNKLINGDAGSLFNVAIKSTPLITGTGFVETSGTHSSPATLSGYQGFVLCKDALGRAGIGDMNPRVIIKKPGSNSTDQPLDTFWTYGVKFRAAHKLLATSRIMRVDSAI